jgi:hypothetical protein
LTNHKNASLCGVPGVNWSSSEIAKVICSNSMCRSSKVIPLHITGTGAGVGVIGAIVGVIGAIVGVIGAVVGVIGARVGVIGAVVGVIGARVGVIGAVVGAIGAAVIVPLGPVGAALGA